MSSTQPLIATTLAVVFLGESPTLPTILGTCCIVGGVTLLSSRSKEQAKKMTWQPRDVFFPLFAGLLFASRDAVVRGAMFTLNNPYIAATTAATTSAIMLMTYLCVGRRWRDLVISRPNFLFLLFSGLCAGFFYFFLFNALSVGSVVVVSPLTGSAPVFVLFFSIAFVSDHESITVRLILGGLIVMFGGSLITVF